MHCYDRPQNISQAQRRGSGADRRRGFDRLRGYRDGVAKIGDVTFICAKPFPGGGDTFTLTYQTQFTIQNKSAEKVVIKPEDITCIFREADTKETLYFKRNELVAEPGRTAVYNGATEFYLETKERVQEKNSPGTYELRVRYNGQTAVFLYGNNGKNVTGSVE